MLRRLTARSERWPLSRPFRIARGVKTAADVVVVNLQHGPHVGRGEAVPYARYDESVESVLAQIASVSADIEAGLSRAELQRKLAAGAARNAIDCALWDLEAQQAGRTVADLAGVQTPGEIVTAVTVSLDEPARMSEAAAAIAGSPLIKVKVDAFDPLTSVQAVRAAAPEARLIVDPNESWSASLLAELLPQLAALRVDLIEQPLAAAEDASLENLKPAVPICADESAHTSADLERVARRYQAVNIKLDKTGGLTEALVMRERVRQLGLTLMAGCMVSTSLSVAPALLVAQDASFIDLDGPWWLAQDRENGMIFANGRMRAPRGLWGEPRA
ncbi:MAG TPA: N-acetyl-D-Glu racemase DgcA [Vitreimonas sp.]|uniref:N-acetyl-D-Glu racemase DgcA n=1 Tax=Vitreimonas sp. TaxID=3069702 RepID=UPI002D230AAD|nr:N-acetyl-D-Glu racemase DgcA [Vitreimonas sp.]HYD88018.1 N-acetyl-D-Glu racemase DgcA [Vitreimonas sp.]